MLHLLTVWFVDFLSLILCHCNTFLHETVLAASAAIFARRFVPLIASARPHFTGFFQGIARYVLYDLKSAVLERRYLRTSFFAAMPGLKHASGQRNRSALCPDPVSHAAECGKLATVE
jgi:hypothetical protein